MTEESINIAIAEACGWRRRDNTDVERLVTADWAKWKRPKDGAWCSDVPCYCLDLNAMHEAESTLEKGSEWCGYYFDLKNVVGHEGGHINRKMVTATARQRAEAFLRAKGLWKP